MQACQDQRRASTVLVQDRRVPREISGPRRWPPDGDQQTPQHACVRWARRARPSARRCCAARRHLPGNSLTHRGVSPRWGPASFAKLSHHCGFDVAATAQEPPTGPGGCPPSYCRPLGGHPGPRVQRGRGHRRLGDCGDTLRVPRIRAALCRTSADFGRRPRRRSEPGYQRPDRCRASDPGDHTDPHRRRCGPGRHPAGHHRCE